MPQVELRSKSLNDYAHRILGKNKTDIITGEDLKSIKSLKIDKSMLNDLVFGELMFFSDTTSLSLNGIDITPEIASTVNNLGSIKTLSISNAKINVEQLKCMKLENLILVNCEGIDIKQFKDSLNIKSITMINCKDAKLKGISSFQDLDYVNLANNEWMQDEDLEDLWESESVKKVNLDGNNNLTKILHDGIEVSNNSSYRPGEIDGWGLHQRNQVSIYSLSSMSREELENLQGQSISISGEDIEFLNTPEGKEVLAIIGRKNSFNLVIDNTAQVDRETLAYLGKSCNMNRVYVQTGWPETQNRGYAFDTFTDIKAEIGKYVDDIKNNTNLTEEQKYLEVRKRITKNISYDFAALNSREGEREYYTSRNLEDGLLNHSCVCAGYSDIMKNLLAELGIESKYVEGNTDTGELHAWNQVKLKGDDGNYHWYNDDVTWDAVCKSTGRGEFNYCLMNDNEFSKTHTCIPSRTEGYGVNTCYNEPPLAVRAAKNGRSQSSSFER